MAYTCAEFEALICSRIAAELQSLGMTGIDVSSEPLKRRNAPDAKEYAALIETRWTDKTPHIRLSPFEYDGEILSNQDQIDVLLEGVTATLRYLVENPPVYEGPR